MKGLIWGSVALLVVIASVLTYLLLSDPDQDFEKAVKNEKLEQTITIYNNKIKDNDKKERKAERFLLTEMLQTKKSFLNKTIDYHTASKKLKFIYDTQLITEEAEKIIAEVERLHTSHTAYKKGEELSGKSKHDEAIAALQHVLSEDKEYFSKAQKLIEAEQVAYKKAIFDELDKLSGQEKYEDALSLIKKGLALLPDDKDLLIKRASLEQFREEQLETEDLLYKDKVKNDQQLLAINAQLVEQSDDFKQIYPDMIEVMVENHTDKTVKNYTVSILAYDDKGFPLKLKGPNTDKEVYELKGQAKSAFIKSGDTYGKNAGWTIIENANIKTLIACVVEVEYTDGTVWENEYYPYWQEEFVEQPLPSE